VELQRFSCAHCERMQLSGAGGVRQDMLDRARDRDVRRRALGLAGGLTAFVLMLLAPAPEGMTPDAWRTAALAVLMATWWITEAIPVYATGLLPLALLPLLGIADMRAAAVPYANPVIFLFLGGFLIALTIQRWNLHQRIALTLLSATGTGARQLVGGFMAATAFLSMWVSNTATAMMMLPIALSVITLLERDSAHRMPVVGLNTALVLAIAYGANVGGMATLVGTPPNALLAAYFDQTYGVTIGFAQWMVFGVPLALVLLAVTWVLLTRVAFRLPRAPIEGAGAAIASQRAGLGPTTHGEMIAGGAFLTAAGLWIFLPLITRTWPDLGLTDSGIAVGVALALFIIPVDLKRGEFALNWEWAGRVPWGVLLLFGGGLSLAAGATSSGLAEWIGGAMSGLGGVPTWLMLLVVVTVVVFLTELTSNTATTATMLPVLGGLAMGLGENPLLLCVPAALAASCAFMLPPATPPNAVAFGSGHVTIPQMARAGILLNLICIAALTMAAYAGVMAVFEIAPGVVPDWAK
jgi:sodium-dependent dicarboxylate transporter 2/3/5